jgi:hypothetical protein
MTDVVRQPEVQVMWLSDTRATITGPLPRVDAAIGVLRRQGVLTKTTNPQPTADGGVLVTVSVLPAVREPRPAATSPWTPRIVTVLAAIIGAVLISCGVLALRGLAWVGSHGQLLLGLATVVVLGALCAVVNAVTGGRLVEVFVRVRVK